ncbi:MAG: FecR family protein [Sandaracinaceae bacterium]
MTASRERECRIELERGTLDMRVEPRQRTRVSILTPHTTVRVLGTVLSVSVDSDETRVTVERGLVQVDAGEVPVELSAHERGLISPRVGIDVRAATQEQLAPLRALAEELLLDPLALAPTTPTVEPPAPDPQPALEVAPAEEPDTPVATRRRVRDLRRMLVAQPPAEVRSRVQEELENPRMARRRAELLTIVAESHLAERDYESALATYGRVWRGPRSSTAANALIAGADVALLRVHEPTRARGLYERYLAEYPNGALREVASAGRCRAIAAVGARDAARRCAVEYDLAYPEGRFGGQLEGLR